MNRMYIRNHTINQTHIRTATCQQVHLDIQNLAQYMQRTPRKVWDCKCFPVFLASGKESGAKKSTTTVELPEGWRAARILATKCVGVKLGCNLSYLLKSEPLTFHFIETFVFLNAFVDHLSGYSFPGNDTMIWKSKQNMKWVMISFC